MNITSSNIIIGNATDVGKVREHNEDYMAHFNTPLGYCIIICDGMGGHAAGDIASQEAVKAIKHYLQDGKATIIETSISLYNAIEFANFKLREMVKLDDSLKGMGTTCVIALINRNEMYVAHAGDSRLYLIRGKEIKQISKDHSTIQNLIDAGILTEKEAENSEKKNQITKAIGIFEKVEPTVTKHPIPLLFNDKILLCSDGLTTHVDEKSIMNIVFSNKDIQQAAMQLIEKANFTGGSDNITVQLIQFTGKQFVSKKGIHRKKIVVLAIFCFCIVIFGFYIYKNFIYNKNQNSDIVKPENVIQPATFNETLIKEAVTSDSIKLKEDNSLKDNNVEIKSPSDTIVK